MRKQSILILSLVVLMSVFCLNGCMRQASLKNPTNLPAYGATGKALSEAQVRQAILLGAKEKGWIARELSPGVISASLSVRKHQAEVEIPYNATSYSIIYKNSHNLKYNQKNQSIHNQYNNWVDYLRRAIDAEMAKLR